MSLTTLSFIAVSQHSRTNADSILQVSSWPSSVVQIQNKNPHFNSQYNKIVEGINEILKKNTTPREIKEFFKRNAVDAFNKTVPRDKPKETLSYEGFFGHITSATIKTKLDKLKTDGSRMKTFVAEWTQITCKWLLAKNMVTDESGTDESGTDESAHWKDFTGQKAHQHVDMPSYFRKLDKFIQKVESALKEGKIDNEAKEEILKKLQANGLEMAAECFFIAEVEQEITNLGKGDLGISTEEIRAYRDSMFAHMRTKAYERRKSTQEIAKILIAKQYLKQLGSEKASFLLTQEREEEIKIKNNTDIDNFWLESQEADQIIQAYLREEVNLVIASKNIEVMENHRKKLNDENVDEKNVKDLNIRIQNLQKALDEKVVPEWLQTEEQKEAQKLLREEANMSQLRKEKQTLEQKVEFRSGLIAQLNVALKAQN